VHNDRTVWIVGDPWQHLPKTDPRYHTGDCYVLDQLPNRGRAKRVRLSELPEAYGPCQICGPGVRTLGGARADSGWHAPTPSEPPRGVQLGHTVHIEYLDTSRRSTVRLISARRERQQGEISAESPLGAALLGKDIGTVAEFDVPKAGAKYGSSTSGFRVSEQGLRRERGPEDRLRAGRGQRGSRWRPAFTSAHLGSRFASEQRLHAWIPSS
jgi:hypothetical protein